MMVIILWDLLPWIMIPVNVSLPSLCLRTLSTALHIPALPEFCSHHVRTSLCVPGTPPLLPVTGLDNGNVSFSCWIWCHSSGMQSLTLFSNWEQFESHTGTLILLPKALYVELLFLISLHFYAEGYIPDKNQNTQAGYHIFPPLWSVKLWHLQARLWVTVITVGMCEVLTLFRNTLLALCTQTDEMSQVWKFLVGQAIEELFQSNQLFIFSQPKLGPERWVASSKEVVMNIDSTERGCMTLGTPKAAW